MRLPPYPALLAAIVAAALLAPAMGEARVSVLYETAAGHRALTGAQPDGAPGLGALDGAYQQQPAVRLIGPERQVAKVSGRGGSPSSPTLLGLATAEKADLLRARITSSGAGLVFIDELSGEFRGPEGDSLGAAMTMLAAEPAPDGVGTMADRVHIYIPAPATLVAQAERYQGSWAALTAAGGVWIETYRGARAWSDAEWAAWPSLFQAEFTARGGSAGRLHLMLTTGDQKRQWTRARSGAACGILANGPGAYRVGAAEAPAFVSEFRSTFGPDPAPSGASPVACSAPAILPPATAGALARTSLLTGIEASRWELPRLWTGIRSSGTVSLGPDPLGLAAILGQDPAAFWADAGAAILGSGPGTTTRAPVRADGTARVSVLPRESGQVRLRLVVPGAAIRRALATEGLDLPASLAAAGASPEFLRHIQISPLTWRIEVPVSAPSASGWTGVAEPPPLPSGGPATAVLARAGAGRVKAAGRDPKRWRLFTLRLNAPDGRPIPATRAIVRRPWMAPLPQRTTPDGLLAIWVPRRSGELRVQVPTWSVDSRRLIGGRPPGNLRIKMTIPGPVATRVRGRDPQRWRVAVVRVTQRGRAAAKVPVIIRGIPGGTVRQRTRANGTLSLLVRARRGGTIRAEIPGTTRAVTRRLR